MLKKLLFVFLVLCTAAFAVDPVIPRAPTVTVGNNDQNLALSVSVLGDNPVKYQWYKDKRPINGETTYVLIIKDRNPNGVYYCRVENLLGGATNSKKIRLNTAKLQDDEALQVTFRKQ